VSNHRTGDHYFNRWSAPRRQEKRRNFDLATALKRQNAVISRQKILKISFM